MLYRPNKPDGLILKVKKKLKTDTAFAGRRMLTSAINRYSSALPLAGIIILIILKIFV